MSGFKPALATVSLVQAERNVIPSLLARRPPTTGGGRSVSWQFEPAG